MPLLRYLVKQYGPACAFKDSCSKALGVLIVNLFLMTSVPLVRAAALANFNNDAGFVHGRDLIKPLPAWALLFDLNHP